jgi:hypothetical protein
VRGQRGDKSIDKSKGGGSKERPPSKKSRSAKRSEEEDLSAGEEVEEVLPMPATVAEAEELMASLTEDGERC